LGPHVYREGCRVDFTDNLKRRPSERVVGGYRVYLEQRAQARAGGLPAYLFHKKGVSRVEHRSDNSRRKMRNQNDHESYS